MRYIEAIEYYGDTLPDNEVSVFLAGGITDCPDWQAEMRELLADTNLIVLNPRRADFDVRDPENSVKQIRWEHWAMYDADIISFWFPKETLCPITLYELGKQQGRGDKKLVIGIHPDYARRLDVEEQTRLVEVNPDFNYSLVSHAAAIKKAARDMADDWNRG